MNADELGRIMLRLQPNKDVEEFWVAAYGSYRASNSVKLAEEMINRGMKDPGLTQGHLEDLRKTASLIDNDPELAWFFDELRLFIESEQKGITREIKSSGHREAALSEVISDWTDSEIDELVEDFPLTPEEVIDYGITTFLGINS